MGYYISVADSKFSIPVDKKLLKLIEAVQDIDSSNDNMKQGGIPLPPPAPAFINNIPKGDMNIIKKDEKPEEKEDSDDESYETIVPGPSNYEHGKHVSFIQELKDKLDHRRRSMLALNVGNNDIHNNNVDIQKLENKQYQQNQTHLEFLSNLVTTKSRLNHITPPPSPKLGRIVPDVPDVPELPELPEFELPEFELPELPEFELSETQIRETELLGSELPPLPPSPEVSSELSTSSDWDSTEEIIMYESDKEYQPLETYEYEYEYGFGSGYYEYESLDEIRNQYISYIGNNLKQGEDTYYDDDEEEYTYDSDEESIEVPVIPDPPKPNYTEHIEQIVEDIMNSINNNNISVNNNWISNKWVKNDIYETPNNTTEDNWDDMPDLVSLSDNENDSNDQENNNDQDEEEECFYYEYYEDTWNSDLVKRKYIDADQNRRLSL